MSSENKTIIGRNTQVDFGSFAKGVPAKIDTGADGSAVWASNISVDENGILRFTLFGKGSPYYTGRMFKRTDYSVAMVHSASGHAVMKFRTHFKIKIHGRTIRVLFGLSDRSSHSYPVLIGRRTLQGKFVVDVEKAEIPDIRQKGKNYLAELEEDPIEFQKKYQINGEES